jgi:hypothetical protein
MLRRNPLAAMALHHPSRHLADAMPPTTLGLPEAQVRGSATQQQKYVSTPKSCMLVLTDSTAPQAALDLTWTERPPGGGAGYNRQYGCWPVWGRSWRTHNPQGAVSSPSPSCCHSRRYCNLSNYIQQEITSMR